MRFWMLAAGAAWLLASGTVRADDARLRGEVEQMQASAARLAQALTATAAGSAMGLRPNATCLVGAALRKGQAPGVEMAVRKGQRYAFVAAGPTDARRLRLSLRTAAGVLVARADGIAPVVTHTAEADGKLSIYLSVRDTGPASVCLLGLLADDGMPIAEADLPGLARVLGARVLAVGGGARGGSLDLGRAGWCVLGAPLEPKGVAGTTSMALGASPVHAVAVAKATVRDLDLALLDANRKVVKADTAKDALPHVEFTGAPDARYSLWISLADAPTRAFGLAALLREGGPAALAPAAAEAAEGAAPEPAPAPSERLPAASPTPDALFGLPENLPVAWGVWRMKRVGPSVCMAPADGSFAIEIWEMSNGFVGILENGSTFHWLAVGARIGGKLDIPPATVAAATPTHRLVEKDGACRKWTYRFTAAGLALTNPGTGADYLIPKLRAELIHRRDGAETVLPAKPKP